MSNYKVVDLGCKKAGALDVYRKAGPKLYKLPIAKAHECLGVDVKDQYQRTVEKKGYEFFCGRIDKNFLWPEADVYLAFDFLEHLPDIEMSQFVLDAMLTMAKKAVWLRLPSFETTSEGEGRLSKLGLRFTWTRWKGHRSHFKLEHMNAVLDQFKGPKLRKKINKLERMRTTGDRRIVPIDAPEDTTKYHPKLGPKPNSTFNPALVGQYEVLIYKDR